MADFISVLCFGYFILEQGWRDLSYEESAVCCASGAHLQLGFGSAQQNRAGKKKVSHPKAPETTKGTV